MTTRAEYDATLHDLNDSTLVEETTNSIYMSARAGNNPHSDYHWKADACYAEAERRDKPWLYQQGYVNAADQAGIRISAADREQAREGAR